MAHQTQISKILFYFSVFNLILLPGLIRAQEKSGTKPATSYTITIDSINKVKYVLSDGYSENEKGWVVKQCYSILSKDSILLYEKLYELHGAGSVGKKYIERITMYGELRNYKILEFLGKDEYLVTRFNPQGTLISRQKVKKAQLNDEWDSKIYTGIYIQEKGRELKEK